MNAVELSLLAVVAVLGGVLVAAFRSLHAERRIRKSIERELRDAEGSLAAQRASHGDEIEALRDTVARQATQIGALNKELETFAYSVSHDLRAPLRHIGGYVQLLTQALEGRLEDEPRRYLAVVAEASRQMGTLIDDLLSFSRMIRTDLTPAPVAPREVVDAVIAGLDADTRARDIDWRIGELPRVQADPAMLRLVYSNLIGNAVKYTAPRERAV